MWGLQLLLAWSLGSIVRSSVAAAMGDYSFLDDGHRLAAISELGMHHPGVTATMLATLATGALLGALSWVLVAGGIIDRLAGARPEGGRLEGFGAACGRWLPAVAVQTLYGLVLRGILVGVGVGLAWRVEKFPLTATVFLVAWSLSVVVLDRARVSVVLEEAPRYSPMTALRATLHVFRRPKILVFGFVLVTLQWMTAYGILALAIGDPVGGATIWLARLGSVFTVFVGLWRVALSVDDSVES
jgi:hypothetical protein